MRETASARRQAPRHVASILDAARKLGIRDAQGANHLHELRSGWQGDCRKFRPRWIHCVVVATYRWRSLSPRSSNYSRDAADRNAFNTSRVRSQRLKPLRPQSRPRRTMTRSCEGTMMVYWPRLPEVA